MQKGRRKTATVLFYPSEEVKNRWGAHCLDWDLVGTGDHPLQAFDELLEVMEFQVEAWYELGDEAAYPEPAPKPYWDAVKSALDLGFYDFSGVLENILKRREIRRARRKLPNRCRWAILRDRETLAAVSG